MTVILLPGAKIEAPQGALIRVRQPSVECAAQGRITLFTAPPGYLCTDSLASLLAEQNKPVLWVNLGNEDKDPGVTLISLIMAARQLRPGTGDRTLEHMRKQPGTVFGWATLYSELGKEVAECLPRPFAVVFEHVHRLSHALPTLTILSRHFLSSLPAETTIILTANEPVPGTDLPARTVCKGIDDLRLDTNSLRDLASRTCADLPAKSLALLGALTRNCAEMVTGALTASTQVGSAVVVEALSRATSADGLLARLARTCLSCVDPDTQRSLALALHLDYARPELMREVLGYDASLAGPWLQVLSNGWVRLREVWRTPMQAALRAWGQPTTVIMRHVAHHLAAHGFLGQSVPLYLSLGDTGGAAQVIAEAADRLLDYGLWDTLDAWLSRFSPATLHSWPWLIYIQGEIAAAQGDIKAARRLFSMSAALFTSHYDADGACQSLLAESVLASWQGDHAHARSLVQTACAMAEASGLDWHIGWAMWQLGCMAAADGELDNALACFERIAGLASFANDAPIVEMIRRVEYLVLEQRELCAKREYHRHAYFTADQAELQTAERLHFLLSAPLESLETILGAHGWSRTPLNLKLSVPEPAALAPEVQQRLNLWGMLQSWLGMRRQQSKPDTPVSPPPVPPSESIINGHSKVFMDESLQPTSPQVNPKDAPYVPDNQNDEAEQPTTKQTRSPEAPTLAVYLLGQFRVFLHDQPVENWPNGRGRALFKYLVTNRERPLPRDVLMETFWPETAPASARNSLNVALHGLRQAFKGLSDVPVIEFTEGAYRFNPQLRIWLDVDEFDQRVKAGHQLEAAGKFAAATNEYEMSAGLYQGDFLPDEPYEEWAVLPRERLRLARLELLDRLSRIYFSQGHYASCATLCQLILAQDNCREDAHCRLMRCYSRQNQHHLAIRQYEACATSLLSELEIKPAAATTQLFDRIRRRERV